jgi:virginiamycin B lyase
MGPQISAPSNPNDIVEGANGGMFVALYGNAGLGELAEDSFGGSIFGSWNDFQVTSAGTAGVASDPNGVLWYAESNNSSVVRMTTYGSLLSRTALTPSGVPGRVAVGADKNSMYVTEEAANKIAKLDLSGNLLSETPITQGSNPEFITAGQDGNMYFTEYFGNNCTGGGYIGQLSQAGVLTMYPTNDCAELGIASANDGNIWFAEEEKEKLAQFDVVTHAITEYAIPSGLTHPYALVSGADGQLWFTTQNSPDIVSFQP